MARRGRLKWTPPFGPLEAVIGVEVWPSSSSDLFKLSFLGLLCLWVCGQRASAVQAQRHVHSLAVDAADDACQTAIGVRLPSAWCGRRPL